MSTGSSSRRSLWDLHTICFRFGQRVLYQLSTTTYLGHLWVAEAEHNIFFMEEVYKQTASCNFFHFLTVVNRLRSNSSEPFAYALVARIRLAFKQNQIAGDSPSNALAHEDMTYCYDPEAFRTQRSTSYCVHGDEFVPFSAVKTSSARLFLPSALRSLRRSLSPPSPPTRPRVPRSQLTRPSPRHQPKALSLLWSVIPISRINFLP